MATMPTKLRWRKLHSEQEQVLSFWTISSPVTDGSVQVFCPCPGHVGTSAAEAATGSSL